MFFLLTILKVSIRSIETFLVDFDEFARVMAGIYSRKFTDEEMRQAFKCFDRDNSGRRTRNIIRLNISVNNSVFIVQDTLQLMNYKTFFVE